MTKAEERKLLDKIEALIKSAGEDSYIGGTFRGVVEICRNNIDNDFGDHPVEDLEYTRKMAADVAQTAKDAIRDRDRMEEDLHKLEAEYRKAVQAARAAQYYIHAAKNRLCDVVDNLPVDASDEAISAAVREHKKAKEALRRVNDVIESSYKSPFCGIVNAE